MPHHYAGLLSGMAQPGLLGARPQAAPAAAAPPEQAGGTSVWDRLLAMLVGPQMAGLSPGQSSEARRNALRTMGLTMMLAGRAGQGPRPDLMSIIAQGMLSGQQAGTQQRRQFQIQNRIGELTESGASSRQVFENILTEALRLGDLETAQTIAEVLKSMGQEIPSTRTLGRFTIPDVAEVFYDTATGEEVTRYPFPPKGEEPFVPRGGTETSWIDEETGEWKMGYINPETLERIEIPGALPPSAEVTSERGTMARFFLQTVPVALEAVDAFEGAPNRLESFLAKANINEVVAEDMQLLQTAGEALGDAYLRLTSGAAIRQEEVEMFMRTYLPQPGDTEERLQFKRVLRAQFAAGLRMLADPRYAGIPLDQKLNIAGAPPEIVEIGRNAAQRAGSNLLDGF